MSGLQDMWTSFWGRWMRASFTLTDEPDKVRRLLGSSAFSQDRALQLSAVWAAVNRKSNTCGAFPLQVMKPGAKGAEYTVRDSGHPYYRMLRSKPNADFTASRLWSSVFAALDLWGNGYLEKQYGTQKRGNFKSVVALDWCGPESVSGRTTPEGGFRYVYRDPHERRTREIAPENMIHFRQFSLGARFGNSAIYHGTRALRSATDIEDAAQSTFANGMRPGGYITTGGKVLTDPQREDARKNLIDDMSGVQNAGKWKLLEGGFEAKPVTINPDDAEMLGSRRFSIEDICRWFDVPPILVGHAVEGQTMFGSGVEQVFLAWLTLSLAPYVGIVETQLQNDLMTPDDEAAGVTLKFNFDALLRADSAARSNFLGSMVNAGIYTRNEARSKENLAPKEGGDELTVQQQQIPLSQVGKQPAAPAPFGAPRQPEETA